MTTMTSPALRLVTWLLATVLTVGCGSGASGGEPGPVYQNQIFTSSGALSAGVSNGDTGRPSFSWPATGLRHVVAAIFRSHIDVQSNLIVNTDQVVWIWHTG